MVALTESKVLKGIEAIRKYIDPINPPSPQAIREWIKTGMPARLIGSTWYAHADNIDQFFLKITLVDNRKTPDEVLQKGE